MTRLVRAVCLRRRIGVGRPIGPGHDPCPDRRPAAVLERRPGQAGDPRPRPCHDRGRQPRLRGAGGSARHLRPGRHALGRAPGLQPGRVRARPGGGARTRASGMEEEGAVQDRAVRRPQGHRQAVLARPRGDRVRDPRRDERRGVQRDRGRLGGQGHGPSLAQALHRAGLPADAGGAGPAARQRLPHLHRHRRRPGLRALLRPSGSTAWGRPR